MKREEMRKQRLVILRGKPTSGKSTAYQSLRYDHRMKKWIFVDHANLKTAMGKEKGKKALFETLKLVMPNKPDIIIEEMSKETIINYLGKEIKKYGYRIIVFQFEISLETAYKRNIQRARDKWHPFMNKEEMEKLHKMHEDKFDKEAILVDCNKLNKKQVVDFIVRKLR